MELDRLEVVFDGDLSPFDEKMSKFEAKLDSIMGRVKDSSNRNMNSVEKNFTDFKGFDKFTQQLEKMNNNFERQFSKLQQSADKNGKDIGASLSKNVGQGAVKMTKDVQSAVDKVNLKMQQAKAAQQRLGHLKSDRNGAAITGNNKSVSRIDEQIAKAQIQMNRSQQEAKSIVRGLRKEYDAIPNSLDSISRKMNVNEGQIEALRQKVRLLKTEMASQMKETGSFASGKWQATGVEETPKSMKTAELISKQAVKMEKLIADNDRLQQVYAQTEDRAQMLKNALSKVNVELGEQSTKSRMASNGMQNLAGKTQQSAGLFNRFKNGMHNTIGRIGSLFNRQSSAVTNGTRQMSNSMGGFGRTLRMLWSQLFIFSFLYQGIMKLVSGLWSAMKTNSQFASSLNQIKVNLLTAFYPIYTAVMPAINALMSALATLTGYIASFIAALFGTTYSAAKQGAAGLQSSIDAMKDTGSATDGAGKSMDKTKEKAKKLHQMLMGFDEINTLTFDDGSDEPDTSGGGGGAGPGGIDWSGAEPETPAWLTNFANKFKDIMSKLFDPIKKAWDAQGQKVIDAWKYALREVGGLIQSIGKSFLEVWTNGTGQRFVENLLILFADVLNIIGDIAGAFRRAWDDGGRGTALIQSIFDKWNAILELLHEIAVSFRNAWNDDGLGQSIAANLLEIYTHINNTIGNLATQLKKAWVNGATGESIFKRILSIANGLLGNINAMSAATEEWAKRLDFTPLLNSIDGLLRAIQPLTQNIGNGLQWFYENVLLPLASYTIQDLIPAFLDALSGAINFLNGVIEGCKPAFDFLWNNILKPIAEWTGGIIVDVLKGIGNALSAVGDWISEHSEAFSTFVTVFVAFVSVIKIISGLSTVIGIIGGLFSGLSGIASLSGLLGAVGSALGAIIGFLGGPLTVAVGAAVAIGVGLWQNWDTIKEKAGQLASWLGEKWDNIKTATSQAWENVKNWTSEKWEAAKTAVTTKAGEIYNSAKEKFTDVANTVKEKAGNAKDWASEKWDGIKTATSNKFNDIKTTVSDKWSEISSKVSEKAELAKNKAASAFETLGVKVGSALNELKTTASDVFSNVGKWASELPGKIKTGISNGITGISNAVKRVANTLISPIGKAVNGVIGGINWVLGSVNASWKLNKWSVPTYAKGTDRHPGGAALVNDAPGSRFREMFKLPDGRMGMFPKQRNLLVDLPRGTQVLPGNQVPQYSGGIFSTFKDFFTNGWDKAKGIAEDVWNVISNPSKLVETAMSKFVSFGGMLEPMISIGKGFLSLAKDAVVDMVVDMINNFTGFEYGGLVDKFGFYQMAEGNSPEMVVPLSKPQLAFQRINEALDFMGYEGIPDLTMPEVFRDSSDGYSGASKASSGRKQSMSFSGNGLESLSVSLISSLGDKIANTILMAISSLNLGGNDEPLEIILEVDSARLGEVTIKGINKVTQKTGRFPLNI